MTYYIVGKKNKEGNLLNDSIIGNLNEYFELGWEYIVSHLYIKHLFHLKQLNQDDVIVTLKDRMFMYEGFWHNVMSYEKFTETETETREVIDLCNLIENNREFYIPKIINNEYENWNNEKEIIKNINYKNIDYLPINNKFCCLHIRYRSWAKHRNLPKKHWKDIIAKIKQKNLIIFVFGKESKEFVDNKTVFYANLHEYASLLHNENCQFVLGTMSGGTLVAQLFAHKNCTNLILITDEQTKQEFLDKGLYQVFYHCEAFNFSKTLNKFFYMEDIEDLKLELSKKVLITGGSGLVGMHLKKIMPEAIYVSSKDYDLTNCNDVDRMYKEIQPTHVIHLAAKVGGIFDNIHHPVEYLEENILMNTLVIKLAYKNNVKRFIGTLSSCIFPDKADVYPMKEELMHSAAPTSTNFSYGISKRTMAVQIESYNKQYGTKYNYIIPCNLYGENDKDDEEKSHFVTALIKKIYEANKNGDKEILLYGDGTPIRQFMNAMDVAKILKIMIDRNITESFNLATKENYSIDEIAQIALKATNSTHLNIKYDHTKPNGQQRKDIDISKLENIIPDYEFILLSSGLQEFYKNYKKTNDENF